MLSEDDPQTKETQPEMRQTCITVTLLLTDERSGSDDTPTREVVIEARTTVIEALRAFRNPDGSASIVIDDVVAMTREEL